MPGPHADDAPCDHRPPNAAAQTPGQESIHPTCRRAQRASAARTRPDHARPRQRHPTGQRQRPHPPAEAPRSRPSPTTKPSVVPCSDPSLSATPPDTVTEERAEPRPEEATRTGSRWTRQRAPAAPDATKSMPAPVQNGLTRRNRLSRPSRPWAPTEPKPRADEHASCPTTPNPRA